MSTPDILFGVRFSLLAAAIFFIVRVEIRLQKLFKGSKADTLEKLIGEVVEHVKALSHEAEVQASELATLEARLKQQGRGVKLVRFNPFADVGSSQSFAVAIMNSQGDGVVFSSLYSRDNVSIFGKPLKSHASEYELSDEEKEAIKLAKEKLK